MWIPILAKRKNDKLLELKDDNGLKLIHLILWHWHNRPLGLDRNSTYKMKGKVKIFLCNYHFMLCCQPRPKMLKDNKNVWRNNLCPPKKRFSKKSFYISQNLLLLAKVKSCNNLSTIVGRMVCLQICLHMMIHCFSFNVFTTHF